MPVLNLTYPLGLIRPIKYTYIYFKENGGEITIKTIILMSVHIVNEQKLISQLILTKERQTKIINIGNITC